LALLAVLEDATIVDAGKLRIKLLIVVSFSKPWGLGCSEYQYEQQWFVGLACGRAA